MQECLSDFYVHPLAGRKARTVKINNDIAHCPAAPLAVSILAFTLDHNRLDRALIFPVFLQADIILSFLHHLKSF